jgi:hypothetical protein
MPKFSAPIPEPTGELEPVYNDVVRKYGLTAGRVLLKLVEKDSCSVYELMECARATGDQVLQAVRNFMADDEVRDSLRPFVKAQ